MLSRTFTNGEACEIVNVPPTQIEVWCRAGLLQPHSLGAAVVIIGGLSATTLP